MRPSRTAVATVVSKYFLCKSSLCLRFIGLHPAMRPFRERELILHPAAGVISSTFLTEVFDKTGESLI